jgi:hypothetical protein
MEYHLRGDKIECDHSHDAWKNGLFSATEISHVATTFNNNNIDATWRGYILASCAAVKYGVKPITEFWNELPKWTRKTDGWIWLGRRENGDYWWKDGLIGCCAWNEPKKPNNVGCKPKQQPLIATRCATLGLELTQTEEPKVEMPKSTEPSAASTVRACAIHWRENAAKCVSGEIVRDDYFSTTCAACKRWTCPAKTSHADTPATCPLYTSKGCCDGIWSAFAHYKQTADGALAIAKYCDKVAEKLESKEHIATRFTIGDWVKRNDDDIIIKIRSFRQAEENWEFSGLPDFHWRCCADFHRISVVEEPELNGVD